MKRKSAHCEWAFMLYFIVHFLAWQGFDVFSPIFFYPFLLFLWPLIISSRKRYKMDEINTFYGIISSSKCVRICVCVRNFYFVFPWLFFFLECEKMIGFIKFLVRKTLLISITRHTQNETKRKCIESFCGRWNEADFWLKIRVGIILPINTCIHTHASASFYSIDGWQQNN